MGWFDPSDHRVWPPHGGIGTLRVKMGRTMKTTSKIAGIGALLLASFLPMTAAHAADCNPPYCNPNVPTTGGSSDSGGVLPSESEKPPVTETAGEPAAVEIEAPAAAETPAPAAVESAPSGSLPFTGGDVVGLTVIGAGALAIGTVLVRRSRKARLTAA
jgi:hypothetical protein